MNLLTQEKIIWSVPAANWARRLAKELEGIKEGRQEARRAEIIAQLPPLQQYRLTFSSTTMREEMDREKLLASVREWFEQEYGIGIYQYNQWFLETHVTKRGSKIEYERGEAMSFADANYAFALIRDIANWASVMVCLRAVEKRELPMHDLDADVDWEDSEIPPEWGDYHKFVELFPRPLFSQAAIIVEELNPGVWTTQLDDDAKNFGGVNVRG